MKTIRKKSTKLIMLITACLVCFFVMPFDGITQAKDSFLSGYIQNVYDQKNGIQSSEVNCLYQSSSGYIWVGTDGGLYRSNGSEFQSINLWDTDNTDVYTINCIMQDSTGRMWIGTDNYGLFYIENGENFHLLDEYYNGIKTINDICQTEKGEIYVATSRGMYRCVQESSGNMRLNELSDERLHNIEFTDIESYASDIWAIRGNNEIYVIKGEKLKYSLGTSDITGDDITCLKNMNGYIYVGTTGRDIIKYKNRNKYELLTSKVDGINGMMLDDNGFIWVSADKGIGYFDRAKKFIKLSDCEMDTYLSDIIQDYEGNYWISSYRMGVLQLSKSKFTDFNMLSGLPESMVNCVFQDGAKRYVGTDDGLYIYNTTNEKLESDLTELLSGTSIRNIMKDSEGTLWISTYRRYGVVKVQPDGEISMLGRNEKLPGISINSVIELSNKKMAIATDNGVAIMDKEGREVVVYDSETGLSNERAICMFEKNGTLFVGTDGAGIYEINLRTDDITNYNTDSGLSSNVVTDIEPGEEGIWIATDNGLCFYNKTYRSIGNIEYSNNIYDIEIADKFVWIIGSKGVLRTTEEELLGTQGVSGRYFDKNDGLVRTLNTAGRAVIDSRGLLYVCCNDGLYTLDTRNISYNLVPPRIRVTAVDVDGERYEFDEFENGLKVSSECTKIVISFAVFSFSNRDNIQVEYYLKGFDEQPVILNGGSSMEAVYTNLDGGVYEFTVSAYNGDGVAGQENISFMIEKEMSMAEKPISKISVAILIIGLFLVLIYAFIKVRRMLHSKNKALEELSKEHEEAVKSSSAKNDYLANMSNEIKTPINAIMVKADEMLRVMDNENSYRESIQGIYDAGSAIIEKVDDIILLAKLEAGKLEVTNAPYSVTTMIYELSEFVAAKIGDQSIKFFVEIGDNIIDNVVGDNQKIKEILIRLLDNAVKFTKEGSITLAVDCFELAERQKQNIISCVFTISDTGIGIQEDRLEDIFEVYNINDNKKKGIHSGNGVGLAIAKGFADILDADLQVESVYGAGSTFMLTVNQVTVDNISKVMSISKVNETLTKENAERMWLPDVNILLVDDEEISREVLLKVLEQFEAKVDQATSGVSAIDMVMNNDYDIVFMDLSMPIMNGIDAMKEIRELEDKKYKVMPIISMDNNAIEDNRSMLLEMGFTDTMVKPADIRRIAAILKDCLPESKLREKSSNILDYLRETRYYKGIVALAPFIDVESSISKIGGSIDVFNMLIKTYYNQNMSADEELYTLFGKNIRSFKVKIHALKTNSVNIGAYDLAKEASMIEAALNIGNKDYIKENIDEFVNKVSIVLNAIEMYIEFIDSVSGMTDEEYAARLAQETKEEEEKCVSTIDFNTLESIKYAALEGSFDTVFRELDGLDAEALVGEDKDFLMVLKEACEEGNIETIDELVTTYMDLKM